MKTTARLITTSVSLFFFVGVSISSALTFSLAAPGPTVGITPLHEDDLLNPGPVPVVPGFGPGLPGPNGFEVNAFSYGRVGAPTGPAIFSVAPPSAGVLGTAVSGEATGFGALPGLGDHTADVYSSMLGGFNVQLWDGDLVVAFGPYSRLTFSSPRSPGGTWWR